MRLSYSVAAAALLGCAGMTLAQAPGSSPRLAAGAQDQPAPIAVQNAPAPVADPNLAPANGQTMSVDNYGAPVNCIYFGLEYVLWTMRETPLKTFGVSVPTVFTITNTVGGVPTTVALTARFGIVPSALGELEGEDLNRNGARLHVGYWLPNGAAIEASFFDLEQLNFAAGFAGRNSALTITTGIAAAPTLTAAATVTGSGFEKVTLWGGEVNYRDRCMVIGPLSVDALVGLRYVDLDEIAGTSGALTLALTSPPTTVTTSLPTTSPFFGALSTSNRIFVGQIGLQGELDLGSFFVGGWLKGGIGANDEQGKLVSGDIVPGSTTQSRTQMDLLGEWNVNAGYQFNNYLRGFVGYNFLYLKNVVRPGNGITDTSAAITLNGISATGGPAAPFAPALRLRDDKFFTHGFTAGVEMKY